mmetsp:Transcript_113007/g.364875  ORF Transcript_113007/g.364875 Transcript_113007/m.364875 type:complete len:205 (+) Transcript_113007:2022-2636(+)
MMVYRELRNDEPSLRMDRSIPILSRRGSMPRNCCSLLPFRVKSTTLAAVHDTLVNPSSKLSLPPKAAMAHTTIPRSNATTIPKTMSLTHFSVFRCLAPHRQRLQKGQAVQQQISHTTARMMEKTSGPATWIALPGEISCSRFSWNSALLLAATNASRITFRSPTVPLRASRASSWSMLPRSTLPHSSAARCTASAEVALSSAVR